MRLDDYAKSGKYLKWNETDQHDISLAIPYEEFAALEPVFSDRHESEQYEIPIIAVDDSAPYESILATKSKFLLVELLNGWKDNENLVLRIKKAGTGFYTKWTVQRSNTIYDKASGKMRRLPAKKKS